MDLYAVARYPGAGFQNEAEAQRGVTLRMKTKERRLRGLFVGWVAVFVASVVCGVVGLPGVAVGGLALLLVLFVPLGVLLLYAPALNCPRCGRRMKKEWAGVEGGRAGEFLVCGECRIYLFTHRTSR